MSNEILLFEFKQRALRLKYHLSTYISNKENISDKLSQHGKFVHSINDSSNVYEEVSITAED